MIRRNRRILNLQANPTSLDNPNLTFIRTDPNSIEPENVLTQKVETKITDLAEAKEVMKNSSEAVTILNSFAAKLLAENMALRKYINDILQTSNTINLGQFKGANGVFRGSDCGIGYLEARPLKITHIKFRTGTSPFTTYGLPEGYNTSFDFPEAVIELLGEYKGGFKPSGYRVFRKMKLVGKEGGRLFHYHSCGATDCAGDLIWTNCITGNDLSTAISKVVHAFCLINGNSLGTDQPAGLPSFDSIVNSIISLPQAEKDRLKVKMWSSYDES